MNRRIINKDPNFALGMNMDEFRCAACSLPSNEADTFWSTIKEISRAMKTKVHRANNYIRSGSIGLTPGKVAICSTCFLDINLNPILNFGD